MIPQVIKLGISGPSADLHEKHNRSKFEKYPYDAGFDLFPFRIQNYENIGNDTLIVVNTGIILCPAPFTFLWITDRSSTIKKLNGGRILDGKIDAGYTGDALVRVITDRDNASSVIKQIEDCISNKLGIAQAIVIPLPAIHIVSVKDMIYVARGANGFGSTN